MEQELLERGVELFHSHHFHVSGVEQEHYLRIALTTPGSMERLREGLQIIRQYIEDTKN